MSKLAVSRILAITSTSSATEEDVLVNVASTLCIDPVKSLAALFVSAAL